MAPNTRKSKTLTQRLRRLFASAEQVEVERHDDGAGVELTTPISDAAPRSRVAFRGRISSTNLSDEGWLEAQLSDGSGSVRLVWMGRKHLECITPGRELLIRGRLAQRDGQAAVFNPEFEVVS